MSCRPVSGGRDGQQQTLRAEQAVKAAAVLVC